MSRGGGVFFSLPPAKWKPPATAWSGIGETGLRMRTLITAGMRAGAEYDNAFIAHVGGQGIARP